MSSIISGPIIQFQIDQNSLVNDAKVAIEKLQNEIKRLNDEINKSNKKLLADTSTAATNAFAIQAAKLRAVYSTGAIGIKDLQVEQKKFIVSLDAEIQRLVRKNDLSKQELTILKQVTLERERQQNALTRGVGVGVTAGTQSALGLVTGSLSKGLGQLGARLAGVAGGSGGSEFSAAASGIAAITANGGVAIGVLGGVATALVGAGIAATSLATAGGNLAEKFSNISQRTGISIKDLQVLDAVAKVTQLDLNDIVIGFRKFAQALTGGAGGEAGGFEGAGKKSSEVLKLLGVTSKDSFTAIEQVATAFEKLPDGPLKAATAVELFGRSGLQLIPILNQGKDGVEKFRVIVEKYGPTINKDAIQAQNDWETATLKLQLQFDRLKLSLIPVLGFMTDIVNKVADIKNATHDPKALEGLGKLFLDITSLPLAGGTANLRLLASFFTDDVPKVESAADGWKKLGFAFDDTLLKAKGTGKELKALGDLLNGATEARKKAAEEAAKQAHALEAEALKTATSAIDSVLKTAQGQGLSQTDSIIHKQVEEIQKIADAIQFLPQLAEQASAAIDAVFAATVRELTKLEEESIQKAIEATNRTLEEEDKKHTELNKLIRDAEAQLAIDRAAASLNGIAEIRAKEKKRVDETIARAKELGATEADLQKLRVTLNQDAQAKIAQLRAEQVKKTRDEIKAEAGRLFDALISGTKNFTQALKQALLAAALTPVKLIFEAVVTAIFTPIVQRVKDAITAIGKSLQGKGGILGKIGDILVPKDSETKTNTVSTNTNTTATDANTAALTALTQAMSVGTPGSGSGAGNQLFSALGFVPPGGLGAPSGGTGGVQGTGGGLLGGLFRAFQAAAPAIGIGLGNALGGKNLGVKVGGGITAAGGAVSGIGAALDNKTLGKVGGVISGGGLVVSGISQGGLGGAAEAALGGAQIGGTFAGPGGALIGAAAGFVAGLIGGLFGHHGPTQADIEKAVKRQTIVNPDQFKGIAFGRSAQGTFADTLNSGFLESPAGNFSSFQLRNQPRAPIVNLTVNAIDAKSVQQLFEDHGPAIGQVVVSQVGSVRSGLGQAVRQAVHPA